MQDLATEWAHISVDPADRSIEGARRVLERSTDLASLLTKCPAPDRELGIDVYFPADDAGFGALLVRAVMGHLAANGGDGGSAGSAASVRCHATRMDAAVHVCARALRPNTSPTIIRDAVHGDIVFNRREYAIIRTRSMQHLHYVRQLGTAYHVYPGAMHTRFEHSLGTFHMAKRFIAELEATGHVLPMRIKEAIRAASLLHDVAHRPFGHTLEDEGRVVLASHDDRALDVIDSDQDLLRALGDLAGPVKAILLAKEIHFPRFHAVDKDNGPTANDRELWKRATDLWPDVEPFMGQIVGDTICADLCDYLRRDALYTGLQRNYDDRILKYVTLREQDLMGSEVRFLAFRIADKGVLSPDAVSEIVHLLNTRHAIGARVYFHHHKMALGGMVCKAVRMLRANGEFQEAVLDEVGDEGFLLYLTGQLVGHEHSSDGPAALARAVIDRNHYRRAYVLSLEVLKTHAEKHRRVELIAKYRDSEDAERNLLEIEHKIASKLGLEDHEVVVSCTDPKMQLKEAEVYVVDRDDEVLVLANAGDELAPGLGSIIENHRRLWRLYVFVHAPDDQSSILKKAADYCKTPEVFGINRNALDIEG